MNSAGIVVVGPRGEVIVADHVHTGLEELELQRYWPNLWYSRAEGSAALTAMFHLEGRSSPSVVIAVPIGDGHIGEYVVGLMITTQSYPAQIVDRALRLGGSGHADIVDERGIALFSTEPEHLQKDSDHPRSYRRWFIEGEAVVGEVPQEEDSGPLPGSHLMAYVPVETLPWAVSIGTTVSDAFAPVQRL